MPKPQVRLDEDVARALQASADRNERSLTVEANMHLRARLGLTPPKAAGPAMAPGASITAPQANHQRPLTPQAQCPHPPGRRIGNHCAACNTTVKG